nr:MAG TPA: hypothetical protein [Caudoviricetes sp.]
MFNNQFLRICFKIFYFLNYNRLINFNISRFLNFQQFTFASFLKKKKFLKNFL